MPIEQRARFMESSPSASVIEAYLDLAPPSFIVERYDLTTGTSTEVAVPQR